MEYTTLGRTGLKVSVAGLGCGGSSRLGMTTGKSEQESIAVVQKAMDLGVNVIDCARTYGTEKIVSKAIKGRDRDSLVLSTKAQSKQGDELLPVETVIERLDSSLKDLGQDCVDLFYVHGVRPDHYDVTMSDYLPAILKERDKGKFRFLGLTENHPMDSEHISAARAAEDEPWDVLMIAFHMLNQKPHDTILPPAIKNDRGVLAMYVVRQIFSDPERLRQAMRDEVAAGNLPPELADDPEPLDFLIHESGSSSLMDAAYRYARHEPGIHVTLFGTGSVDHVEDNINSILRPPLPETDRKRLADVFGHLRGVGLDAPTHLAKPGG